MKKLIIFFSFLAIALCQSTWKYQPMDLVSIPTAGTLPKGHYCLENLFMDEGGILPKFQLELLIILQWDSLLECIILLVLEML